MTLSMKRSGSIGQPVYMIKCVICVIASTPDLHQIAPSSIAYISSIFYLPIYCPKVSIHPFIFLYFASKELDL